MIYNDIYSDCFNSVLHYITGGVQNHDLIFIFIQYLLTYNLTFFFNYVDYTSYALS